MGSLSRKCLALTVGLAGALVGGEVLARGLGLGDGLMAVHERHREIARKHPELAREATRERLFEPDPFLGVRPILGGPEYGIHGALKNKHPSVRPPGKERWLFAGDSVTRRGFLVRSLWRQGAPSRSEWREAEWWNAGVESYGFAQVVEYLERYCADIEPDRIFFTIHNNDLSSTPIVFEDESGELVVHTHRSGSVPAPAGLLRQSHLARALVLTAIRMRSDTGAVEEETRAAFARLLELGEERGFELTFVLLPYLTREDWWGDKERHSRAFFRSLLEDAGARWFDLMPALEDAIERGIELHQAPGDRHHPSQALADVFAEHLLADGFP